MTTAEQGPVPRLLLTPEEAARALGIGRTKLYDLLRTKMLPSVTIGGSRRIRTSDLTALVEALVSVPATKVTAERSDSDLHSSRASTPAH